ncbi:30S ribosomal protein S8 [Candidatus Woesearchaeota archaeon]|nr:30S ribosomal protein S8 [Candidatus Woesearchaeota archaeon]
MLNDPLSNALSKISTSEKTGKVKCTIKPVSNVIKNILEIMQDKGYVGEFNRFEDGRGDYIQVNLIGRINKCGAIKPKYPIKQNEFEKFEQRYLPAKDFGIIFISTSKGIMTHTDAKEKGLGGILLAFVY